MDLFFLPRGGSIAASYHIGPVAQGLERSTHNRLVVGSNPTRPITSSFPHFYFFLHSSILHFSSSKLNE
jgi:hypothetical protein